MFRVETKVTHMKIRNLFALMAAGILGTSLQVDAQVLMSAGTYTQNFDTLANTGTANTWTDNSTLTGWYASKSGTGGSSTAYQASTGTITTGALYSFGAAASTERAFGSIESNASGDFAYGV